MKMVEEREEEGRKGDRCSEHKKEGGELRREG
jgi:hypothetical protein